MTRCIYNWICITQFYSLIIQHMNNHDSQSSKLLNPLLNRISLSLQNNSNSLHQQKVRKLALPKMPDRSVNCQTKSHTEENLRSRDNSPTKDTAIVNRWKLNRPYIQGYVESTKNDYQDKQKSERLLEVCPKINQSQQCSDVFFTDISSLKKQNYINHQQIKSTIEKSKDIIKLIKANRKKLIKLKFRYPTDTSHSLSKDPNHKSPQKIYDYLNRRQVLKKQHVIDEALIKNYMNYSPPKKLQRVQQKGRKFLLEKMHSDYSNHDLVQGYKKQKIIQLIEKDLQEKKRQFSCEYKNRYSTPYFSFLSLDQESRLNVIERKSLLSPNKFYS